MSVHDDEQPGGERPDEHSNPSTEPDGQGFGLPRPSRTLTALTSIRSRCSGSRPLAVRS